MYIETEDLPGAQRPSAASGRALQSAIAPFLCLVIEPIYLAFKRLSVIAAPKSDLLTTPC